MGGENELYETLHNKPGSVLRTVQEWALRTLGYSAPYFLGVGSQPWPGSGSSAIPMNPVPRRYPVITVIGDPIPCERIENPTQEIPTLGRSPSVTWDLHASHAASTKPQWLQG